MKKRVRSIIAHAWPLLMLASMAVSGLYAAFDDTTPGARVRALGGTFCAIADDSESVFAQPAGLAAATRPQVAFTYGRLFMGLSDNSELSDGIFSAAIPLSARWGAGLGYKNTALDAAYREESVTCGLAWRLHPRILAGASAKYLRLSYGSDAYTLVDPVFAASREKTGIDFDAGLIVQAWPFLSLAYSRQNLAGADLGLREKAPAPAIERIGLAYREPAFRLSGEYQRLDTAARFLAGVEKSLVNNLLTLRFGLGWGDRNFRKIAAGFGLNFDQFGFDYAWDYPLSGIERTSGTHYLTLVTRIGKPAAEQESVLPAEKMSTAAMEYSASACRSSPRSEILDEGTIPQVPAPAAARVRHPLALYPPFAPGTDFEFHVSSISLAAPEPAVALSTSAVISTPLIMATTSVALPGMSSAPAVVSPPAAGDGNASTTTVPAPSRPRKIKRVAPHAPQTKAKPEQKPAARGAVPERSLPAHTHKVATGDTLPSLAEKYYGNKAHWIKIYEANKDRIEKGSLEPDQIVIIP